MIPSPNLQSNSPSSRWEHWALVCLFLISFLLRACYPISRPLQWHDRSIHFVEAVAAGDFDATLYSEHPGVTVMWLSGLSQWGYYGVRAILGQEPSHPLATSGRAYTGQIAAGLFPLALLISLGMLWGWRLLKRLAGRRVAWMATLFWALDPFFLANSKVLHLDALLSTLMLLSALYMLLYLRQRDRASLLWSAALGGLALLTKTAALFLVPFFGLCLLLAVLDRSTHGSTGSHLGRFADRLVRPFALWLLVALLVWIALWPAMWVRPGDVLDLLYQRGFVRHAVGGRPLPLFYRGDFFLGDPGVRFYVDGILFRSTFLSLPFAVVGLLIGLWRGCKKKTFSPRANSGDVAGLARRDIFLLGAFIFFFFIQMSLGAGKDVRYLLPAFLVIDLLAATGLLWWVDGLSRLFRPRRLARSGMIGVLVLIQAALILPRFPYFGLHYNQMLGGAQAVQEVFPLADFGEGLDKAGRYLDSLPDAPLYRVSTQYLANEMLAQYIQADIFDVAQVRDDAEYLVFGTQYNARSVAFPRWGEMWDVYKFRPPLYVASFDGVPYAWIYRTGESASLETIPHRLQIVLEPDTAESSSENQNAIHLVGYRLKPARVTPGDTLLLTLYWQVDGPVDEDFVVFTHLQAPDGRLVAQQDNPPLRGAYPTSQWATGELIQDPFELPLPADAPHGAYTLSVGMYRPTDGQRLLAQVDGGPLPENRVLLTDILVSPALPTWRWILAWMWLGVVTAGGLAAAMVRREKKATTTFQEKRESQ